MNWQTKKLGDVLAFVQNGYSGEQNGGERGLPITRIETIQNNKLDLTRIKFVDLKEREIGKYRLDPGDIIFNHINSEEHIGKVAIYQGRPPMLIHGVNLLRLKTDKLACLPGFLYYFFLTRWAKKQVLQKSRRAVNQASINQKQLRRIKIPLPPLPIQQKIVERLDTIRKTQELNEKQISLANELFQSSLHRELKPKRDWMVRRLGEVCEVNPKTNLDSSKKKVKYVEMAAIDENLKEIKYFLDRPTNKVSSGASKFKNGDVIFARITPCTENGKVSFVEDCHEACAGSTELHVLRAKQKEVLPRFLFYCLVKPRVKNMAVASMTGTTGRQRVPAEFFRYLKIPLPPLKTQRQIVRKLSAVQEYKKKLLEQKQLLQELFESTLNKAMRGELIR